MLLVGLQGGTRLKVLSGRDRYPWQVLLSFRVWIAMGSHGALRATDPEHTSLEVDIEFFVSFQTGYQSILIIKFPD